MCGPGLARQDCRRIPQGTPLQTAGSIELIALGAAGEGRAWPQRISLEMHTHACREVQPEDRTGVSVCVCVPVGCHHGAPPPSASHLACFRRLSQPGVQPAFGTQKLRRLRVASSLAHLSAVVRQIKESPHPDIGCGSEEQARVSIISVPGCESALRQSPDSTPQSEATSFTKCLAGFRRAVQAAPRSKDWIPNMMDGADLLKP